MENDYELLTRRKRVDAEGEWVYECVSCENWLLKSKFRGCVDYIDAYGNCLMCSSCKSKKAQITQKDNLNNELNKIMKGMGFDVDSDIPIYIQFHEKHNLPLKRRDR